MSKWEKRIVVTPARMLIMLGAAVLLLYGARTYVARATPGPGGESQSGLLYAGSLRGTSGPQNLKFSFKKGAAAVCEAHVTVTPEGPGGYFSTAIPLTGCPAGLFDGSAVTYDVSLGTSTLAVDQPVGAVPYARYADRVGTPDCPVGYERDTGLMDIVLCKKGSDEMVRVGQGGSAFWIDRYEASVWQNADGTGSQYGLADGDYPAEFPKNGQVTKEVYAVSKAGVVPSAYLTWFQAVEACAAGGKVLPGRVEWLRAARGAPDPGANPGDGGLCRTQSDRPRQTAQGSACASRWGAQDMIGNLWEWTDEWYASVGTWDATKPKGQQGGLAMGEQPWPAGHNDDRTWNIASHVYSLEIVEEMGGQADGLPAAALRGGSLSDGSLSGIFALYLSNGPSRWYQGFGFRCLVRR